MQALATGKAWLSDKTSAKAFTNDEGPRVQQQLDGYLKIWKQPLTISLDD